MNETTKNALTYLILSSIGAFILLLLALLFYHSRTVDAEYLIVGSLKTGLVFRNTLIHALKLLPALVIFIFITSFSIFYTLSPFQTESFRYSQVVVPSFIVLLFFIVLIVVSEFLFIPRLRKENERLHHASSIAYKSLTYAKELHRNNESTRAREVLEIYREIDDKNKEANRLYDNIVEKLHREKFPVREIEEYEEVEEEQPTSFEKGKTAYAKGNYYEALFYFERALALHGDNREIRELHRRVKEKVDRLLGSLSKDEMQIQRLVQQKEKAITLLEEGDYYNSYRILSGLRKKYPDLYDLELYYRSAKGELMKIDFLPQEIEKYKWLPSFNNVVFIDKQGYMNTVAQIIAWKDQFYFLDITRHRVRKGRVERVRWKYGKWINGRIRLKNKRDFEEITPDEENKYYILTDLHPGYIIYFNDSEKLLNQLTIYERFTLGDRFKQSGFDIEDKFVYLARSWGIFFSVYVLSLLLSGIAWSKRSIYEFPPFFKLFLFIIIAPILCYLFHHLYIDANNIFLYSHRYATRYLFKSLNIAIYTAIINLVIAILSTVFFLSQSSRVE